MVDHGEREMALKAWTLEQLSNNYGDFERLLQAKNGELHAMVDAM